MIVGTMLCTGRGVQQDKKEGSKWFLKANEGEQLPFSLEDAGCE
jgi:TPR repeat protein